MPAHIHYITIHCIASCHMTYNIHTYLHTYMNTCHTIPVYIPAFHYIHAYIITPIHYRRHYIAIHTCIHTYMHTYMYNTSSSPGHEGRDNTSLSLSLSPCESHAMLKTWPNRRTRISTSRRPKTCEVSADHEVKES